MATNYDINYDDSRFKQVESQKTNALSNLEKTYAGMINQSDAYYDKQIEASKNWADKQAQMQQEKTDFAIQQIEQQKAQAQKDYTKEQSGAYVDWQKQSNAYGANAEQMAAQGMAGSGYSESAQVSMYNTYQNRVATAREAFMRATLNYDNSIREAQLQNNSLLAEIAYEALQKQLELSLQGFQYKNQLVLEKASKKVEMENMYYNRYQDVLKQINTENAMAEEVRQYNESKALEQEKLKEQARQHDNEMAYKNAVLDWEKEQAEPKGTVGGGGSGSGGSSGGGSSSGKSINPNKKGYTSKATNAANAINNKSKKTWNDNPNNKSSGEKTIDMNSVLALGYGPISEAKLDELVAKGLVEKYTSGNKIKFRKSAYTNKMSKLFR